VANFSPYNGGQKTKQAAFLIAKQIKMLAGYKQPATQFDSVKHFSWMEI